MLTKNDLPQQCIKVLSSSGYGERQVKILFYESEKTRSDRRLTFIIFNVSEPVHTVVWFCVAISHSTRPMKIVLNFFFFDMQTSPKQNAKSTGSASSPQKATENILAQLHS